MSSNDDKYILCVGMCVLDIVQVCSTYPEEDSDKRYLLNKTSISFKCIQYVINLHIDQSMATGKEAVMHRTIAPY